MRTSGRLRSRKTPREECGARRNSCIDAKRPLGLLLRLCDDLHAVVEATVVARTMGPLRLMAVRTLSCRYTGGLSPVIPAHAPFRARCSIFRDCHSCSSIRPLAGPSLVSGVKFSAPAPFLQPRVRGSPAHRSSGQRPSWHQTFPAAFARPLAATPRPTGRTSVRQSPDGLLQ